MRHIAAGLGVGLAAVAGLAFGATEAAFSGPQRQEAIARTARALRDVYVYPDVGARAASSLEASYRSGMFDELDARAFARKLGDELRRLTHDPHMLVLPPGSTPFDALPGAVPPSTGGVIRAAMLRGNVGYVEIAGFPDRTMFKDAADAVMNELSGTRGLIIDLRRGSAGGSPASVAYLCGFFLPARPSTHLNDVIRRTRGTNEYTTESFYGGDTPARYLDRPVVILTSSATFSGDEEFAYDLQVLRRARVVGQSTAGGANPGGFTPIGSGMAVFVASGRARNPVTGTNWQGGGVQPDVRTPAVSAFRTAYSLAANSAGPARARSSVQSPPEVEPAVERWLLEPPAQPTPGREAALRDLIEGAAAGKPPYERMTPEYAAFAKRMLATAQAKLSNMGALRALKFSGRGLLGEDNYRAIFESGAMDWSIYTLSNGKIYQAMSPNLGPMSPPS